MSFHSVYSVDELLEDPMAVVLSESIAPKENTPLKHAKIKMAVASTSELGFSSTKKFDQHVKLLAIQNGWDPQQTTLAFSRIFDSTLAGQCSRKFFKLCLQDLENSKADSNFPQIELPPLAAISLKGFFLKSSGAYK